MKVLFYTLSLFFTFTLPKLANNCEAPLRFRHKIICNVNYIQFVCPAFMNM